MHKSVYIMSSIEVYFNIPLNFISSLKHCHTSKLKSFLQLGRYVEIVIDKIDGKPTYVICSWNAKKKANYSFSDP